MRNKKRAYIQVFTKKQQQKIPKNLAARYMACQEIK